MYHISKYNEKLYVYNFYTIQINFFFQNNHWIYFLHVSFTYLIVNFLNKLLELYKNCTDIINSSYQKCNRFRDFLGSKENL
jgi:hypothetical protein